MDDQGSHQVISSLLEQYPMTKAKSGKVYVFSHAIFNNRSLGERRVAILDCIDIKETFTHFGFDVIVHTDLIYSEILRELSKLEEMDYSSYDCVVIFVLTHGKNGKLYARDIDYYPDVYWKLFNEKNSSFLSKPKLIFVQAARGDQCYGFEQIGDKTMFPIPYVPDVLVMYSFHDIYFSWYSGVSGSCFVDSLCNEFRQNGHNTDILALLTSLNLKLGAYSDKKSQSGTIVSTLTKSMYFKVK